MPPALSKRIAGLPAWAWIAVVAGGLTIGLILRSRQTNPDDYTADDPTNSSVDGPADNVGTPVGGDGASIGDYGYAGNPSYLLTPSSTGYPIPSATDPNIITDPPLDYSDEIYQGAYDATALYYSTLPVGSDGTTTDVVNPPSSGSRAPINVDTGSGHGGGGGHGGSGGHGGHGGNDNGGHGHGHRNGGHHGGGHGNNKKVGMGAIAALTGGGPPARPDVHSQPTGASRAPVEMAVAPSPPGSGPAPAAKAAQAVRAAVVSRGGGGGSVGKAGKKK